MKKPAEENSDNHRWACPGFFRMPETGDGGICRIKLPLGRITPKQLRAVSHGAKEFGNKIIEITNRSNFQIRGVMKNQQAPLSAYLLKASLGPTTAEGDDIRNVMVNPTVGFDRTTLIDTHILGENLLDLLQNNSNYTALSPKFSFYLDGGEESPTLNHAHDIWLSAIDHEHFAFGFASSPLFYENNMAIGKIKAENALLFIKKTLDIFLEFQKKDIKIQRIKHLCLHFTPYEIAEKLIKEGVAITSAINFICRQTTPMSLLGKNSQTQSGLFYISALAPLGRVTPKQLEAIANLVETNSPIQNVFLTSWRGIIIPNCKEGQAKIGLEMLSNLGFAVSPDNPYAHIACCAGAPFCRSAHSNVKRDAASLAQSLSDNNFPDVHLTGCSKSCASTNPYPMTLLAQSDGKYTLYKDKETGRGKFGQVLANDITIEQAVLILKQAGNDR